MILPLLDNPIGLDARIQQLQQLLAAGLPRLDAVYGKATVGMVKGPATTDPVELQPEVYMGQSRYQPVTPSDRWAGHSFIQVAGAEQAVEVVLGQPMTYTATLELIILCNLDNIRATHPHPNHRFTEELKAAIKKALRFAPNFAIERIYENPSDVLRGYTYHQHSHQTFRHPQAGFKFVLATSYDDVC